MPDPYFSELKFMGAGNLDFIEVAVDAGRAVNDIQVIVYHLNGRVRSTNSLGSGDGTMAGRDVYVIDRASSATFSGIHREGAVALVVNGVVTDFYSFDESVTATEGPASGMTSTQLGGTNAGESLETSDNGASYQVQTTPTPDTVPCFLSGTPIRTPTGLRAIETLRAGDSVWTEDAGFQPILWAGSRRLDPAEAVNSAVRPIRVPAHAFAPGAPSRDVYLSPNHRVILSHALCALYFRDAEVLAPIKALVGFRGIGPAPVALPVRYHHLLMPEHAILRAAGLAAESFHPEQVGLAALSYGARDEIAAVMPAPYGQTARMVLKPAEATMMMRQVGADTLDPAPRGEDRIARSRAA